MTKADKIFKKKEKFINDAIKKMDRKAVALQSRLMDILVKSYFSLFEVDDDGNVVNSVKNIALINKLDNLIDRIAKQLQRDVLGKFATSLLDSAVLSAEYYKALGFKSKTVDSILWNKLNLEKRIGLKPSGKLDKKGYLYRLGQTNQVRETLKNYVLTALDGNTPFASFQLGFRNLVIGNKRKKGLATNGALQSYFDQFAYDTFNQLDATTERTYADSFGLKHFVYQGSIIENSREFCKKRAGKAFTIKETENWKNDPTLPKLKGGVIEPYNPLIDRGRFRCRHSIKYITEPAYNLIKKRQAKR